MRPDLERPINMINHGFNDFPKAFCGSWALAVTPHKSQLEFVIKGVLFYMAEECKLVDRNYRNRTDFEILEHICPYAIVAYNSKVVPDEFKERNFYKLLGNVQPKEQKEWIDLFNAKFPQAIAWHVIYFEQQPTPIEGVDLSKKMIEV